MSMVATPYGAPNQYQPPDYNVGAPDDGVSAVMNKAIAMDGQITPKLEEVVQELAAREPPTKTELRGLAFRLKGLESFGTKLKTPGRNVLAVNDALRYTFIVSNDSFSEDVNKIKSAMVAKGIAQNKCKNFFCPVTNMYRGLNCTFIYKANPLDAGYIFEVQFHTVGSFQSKMDAHGLYEQYRLSKNDTSEDAHKTRCRLAQEMRAIYAKNGVTTTGDASTCAENTVEGCDTMTGGRRRSRRKRSTRRKSKRRKRRSRFIAPIYRS